ncbi:TonB-dependent receptor plug domain-containing protein [Roseateles sp. DB2]|uniref:TonB-dependent receptor plug domain-containing protein n=1 Tax=Roseateles sp. DB2 TaxID=3453717 RepID=UPI003EEBE3DE
MMSLPLREALPLPLLPLTLALSLALPAAAQTSPDGKTPPPQEAAATSTNVQPTVVVTGSRISRLQSEGPSPVTVIRGADLDRLGYKNVSDALANLTQNTGFTQGEDFGNTFTPAANAISLRGLGPNHSLVLLNGRRIADYPAAYEGSVNFVNLANLPSALIDRIEVLSGGASAIYGSDAIAGVVNVVLKKSQQDLTLDLKAGGTQLGGGENLRLQLSGGLDRGALQGVWGLELSGRQPIWSRQREFMADTTLAGAQPAAAFARRNAKTRQYLDPGAGVCESHADLFDGSLARVKTKDGFYCGTGRASPSYWTTQTGNRSLSLLSVVQYALDPGTELFAEGLLSSTSTENNTRGPSWTSAANGPGYFLNTRSGQLETWSRRLAPEELGGAQAFNREWRDRNHSLALGVRGEWANGWSYEAAASTSGSLNRGITPRFLAGIDEFFLGPKQGVDAKGVPSHAPDPARLFTPLAPAEFEQLIGRSESRNRSWTHNLSLSANGDWLTLPAGPLKAALVAELGTQGFRNAGDPRLGQGVFYNTSEAVVNEGTRSRAALGAELRAPLSERLAATGALRYDTYRFAGRKDGSLTHNAGLEFRPNGQWLLRAQAATSFRAPDMEYIYTALSRGYYASSTDYYRCKKAGGDLDKCDYAEVSPGFNYARSGSKDLKSEKGRSFNLGVVWAPSADLDFSADLWKVRIKDLVTDLSGDAVLQEESRCRTGEKDVNSPACQATIARVKRNPDDAVVRPGEVAEIWINPINAARQSTHGVDLSARYRWTTTALGQFTARAQYTRVLGFVSQAHEQDPADNLVGTREFGDWPEKLQTSLSWKRGAWSATLSGNRNGRIPASATDQWIAPQWLFNASASLEWDRRTTVGLIVNNLRGTVRKDPGAAWPYYPVGYYLPHGRQVWVTLNHRLGS